MVGPGDTSTNPLNPPWLGSVDPFEHFDSERTHRFVGATFGGSHSSNAANQVVARNVTCPLPTPFNSAIDKDGGVYVYGGGYGDVNDPPGSFVAKLDAVHLSVQWWQQLTLTRGTTQWDYPGAVAVHENGFVYCICANTLNKLDPNTGTLLGSVILPALSAPENTACNGFTGLADGTIVSKNLSRPDGCYEQGFSALTQCEGPTPDTMLVMVDPDSLDVLDCVQGPGPASGRITATVYKGVQYVYLVGYTHVYRYIAENGKLWMDERWGPIEYLRPGQMPATAIAVIGDFLVFNTNAAPSTAPMTIWAYSQQDDKIRHGIQPFDDKDGQDSFLPAMVSVDPENGVVYAMDTGTGQFAAIDISPETGDLSRRWIRQQSSFSYTSLVGPADQRVIVGSDIPIFHEPGTSYKTEYHREEVVWRDAADGRELARSDALSPMSQGAALSPGRNGVIYYPGANGQVVELNVTAS